jgi:hypothetical protein
MKNDINENKALSQTSVSGSASAIMNTVLNTHFGTDKKEFECKLFDNENYIFSSFHHSEFLAWTAGENWKMLGKTKDYKLN